MTHAYLGLAAFDVLMTIAGWAVLACVGLVRSLRAAVRYVGLAFFVGWALVGLLTSFTLMAGVDSTPVVAVVALVIAVVAICVLAARRLPAFERPMTPPDRNVLLRLLALAGAVLIVVALVAGFFYAVRQAADPRWDVWAVWLPKAKAIYYFHGLATGLGGFTTYLNPFYPPLVPAVTATMFHFMGGVHTDVLPVQESVLGAMWTAAVVALLAPRVKAWLLYPLLALVVLAPDFWSRLATVLPDQTVGYLLALAAIAGILWLEERRGVWLFLATFFLAGAAYTKEEGLFLGALLAAALIGTALVPRPRRGLPALVLAIGPALIEPWRLWLVAHHLPSSPKQYYNWGNLVDPTYLHEKFWRLQYALPRMVDFVFSGGNWTLVPPLVIAGLVVVAFRLPTVTAALAAWLVVGFFGLAVVYWIASYSVYWYVGYSAHRVLDSLPLVAATLLPLLLALALERSRPGTARTAEVVGERDLGEEHAALSAAH